VAIVLGQRRTLGRDLPLSLLVHGGVAAVVLSARLSAPVVAVAPPATVLWFTSREPPVEDAQRDVPEPADTPRPPADVPATRAAERAAQPDVPPPALAEQAPADAPRSLPRNELDWERARRAAITQLLEEREHAPHYATFSGDDFAAPPTQAREPVPTGEVFSPNANGPSLFSLGQQHTRFGRKLAEICHVLTGGFGVALQGHVLFNLCAAEGGRSDLFAAIKPEYLKLEPDCATDLPPEVVASIPPALIRCRLVAPRARTGADEPL